MKTHAEYDAQLSSQRLSDLQDMTAELERRLSDARLTLERAPQALVFGMESFFQRDRVREFFVLSLIDCAHPTLPDSADDAIAIL